MVSQSTSAEKTYRVAISILAAAGGVALLYYGQVFFITVIIAFMIAFLLEPAVRLFMKIRMPRGLASFLVCALWLGCLYFAGLGLYTEGMAMVDDLPAYGARINQLVDSAAVRVEALRDRTCTARWCRNASRIRTPFRSRRRSRRRSRQEEGRRAAPSPPRSRKCACGRNPPRWSATSMTICVRSTASC